MVKRFHVHVGVLLTLAMLFAVVLVTAASADDASRIRQWQGEGWSLTDFEKASVKLTEILSGGPPKDGIPSIDEPVFASQSEVSDLAGNEPVIGVALDGIARAYPLRVLIWHEIVNDIMGDTPITVTYCPLCNSAVVFDRRVDGRILDFGTTGKLRNSDLVMYDRQTESWWQQFIGEAVVGELTGTRLRTIPARLESYAAFSERHPDGKVLVPNNPSMRNYGHNPYVGYDERTRPLPFFFTGEMPEGIEPMARVVAFRVDGKPRAVAMNLLAERKTLQEGDVTLTWTAGQSTALGKSRISEGRDVGSVTAQRTTGGRTEDIVYDVTFAFVFHAFHPEAAIRQK